MNDDELETDLDKLDTSHQEQIDDLEDRLKDIEQLIKDTNFTKHGISFHSENEDAKVAIATLDKTCGIWLTHKDTPRSVNIYVDDHEKTAVVAVQGEHKLDGGYDAALYAGGYGGKKGGQLQLGDGEKHFVFVDFASMNKV